MGAASVGDQIIATAQQYGVDPNLALEVATAESNLNQNAVSPKGAIGVFQLMPATAAMLGVDPTILEQNIDGGVRYLSQLLSQFGGDISAALGAYNWGPANVSAAMAALGGNWLSAAPAETQAYVAKIIGALGEWTAALTPAGVVSSVAAPAIGALWDSLGPTGQMAIYVGLGVVGLALGLALIF